MTSKVELPRDFRFPVHHSSFIVHSLPWEMSSLTAARSKSATTSGLTAFRPPSGPASRFPSYCWHPGLSVVASCRMCLVETGTRNPDTGADHDDAQARARLPDAGQGRHRVRHQQRKGAQSRAMVEEDLLIDHPIDCPICDKAGECLLAGLSFRARPERSGGPTSGPSPAAAARWGSTVTLFVDRCVMCSRCVRFTPRDQRHAAS